MKNQISLLNMDEAKLYARLMAIIPFIVSLAVSAMLSDTIVPKKKVKTEQQNPISKTKTTPLTVEDLRTYKGFASVIDQEAENTIKTYRTFSELTYRLFQQKNKLC